MEEKKATHQLIEEYLIHGEYSKAETAYRKEIFNNTKDTKSILGLTILLRKAKCYREAEECAYILIDRWSSNVNAWYEMGLVKQESGKEEEAMFYFSMCLTINSDYMKARVELAYAYGRKEQHSKGIDVLRKGLSISRSKSNKAIYQVLIIRFLVEQCNEQEAEEFCKKEIDMEIKNILMLHTLPIYYKTESEISVSYRGKI